MGRPRRAAGGCAGGRAVGGLTEPESARGRDAGVAAGGPRRARARSAGHRSRGHRRRRRHDQPAPPAGGVEPGRKRRRPPDARLRQDDVAGTAEPGDGGRPPDVEHGGRLLPVGPRRAPVRHGAPRVRHRERAWGRFLLLLEDMDARGYRPYTISDRADPAFAMAMVTALAELHGPFWESPRFERDLAWVPTFSRRQGHAYLRRLDRRARTRVLTADSPATSHPRCVAWYGCRPTTSSRWSGSPTDRR